MAVELISSVTKAGAAYNDPFTSNPINTTGANFLILALASFNGAPTISDSKGNTWIPLTAEIIPTNGQCQLFYVAAPTVGTGHTFSIGTGAYYSSIAVLAFSGVGAFVSDSGNQNLGATIAPGELTPTESNCLFVTAFGATGTGESIDSSFIKVAALANVTGVSLQIAIAYKLQSAILPENPTWINGASGNEVAVMALFGTEGSEPPAPSDIGYEYRVDGGSPVDVGDVLTATVTGLVADTTYSFQVRSYDGLGNYSSWCTAVTATTLGVGASAFLLDDSGDYLIDS